MPALHSLTSDEELVAQAQTDAQSPAWDVLLTRYRPLLIRLSTRYGWAAHGWTLDDVLQILRIGLWQAVMRYDPSRSLPFAAWLRFIVRRRLADTFKYVLRQKHQSFNQALRLDAPLLPSADSSELLTVYASVPDAHQPDPADILADYETVHDLLAVLTHILSDKEWRILWLVLQRIPYNDIARQLHTNRKSIDNAMQRVRRKCLQLFVNH